MKSKWSPHPRYRLYTHWESYGIVSKYLLCSSGEALEARRLLESEICRRLEVNAACCVPMARTGLYFALLALIRPGEQVILSPLTIVDVVNMVVLAGGIPVFADVRPRTCQISPDEVNALINDDTGAVIITHLHGESAGVFELRNICNKKRVPLIEDAAQAFGTFENGRRLGTIGDIGIFSLGLFKNMNAWGGGILVSQDEDLIQRIRQKMKHLPILGLRQLLGIAFQGLVLDLATWPPFFATITYPILRRTVLSGITALSDRLDPERKAARLSEMPRRYLFQMTAAQAHLARKQLKHIDADSKARIAKALMYERGLAFIKELTVPASDGLSNSFGYYPVQHGSREAILGFALRLKRDFAAQYLRNCADLPDFREFYRDCPHARTAARELILLPTYPRYPDSEVHRNIDVIQQFFRQRIASPPIAPKPDCRADCR